MGIFDLFKRSKKVKVNDVPIEKEIEFEKVELIPNTFLTVSKQQFKEELSNYFNLEKYGFGIATNEKIRIYKGDIFDINEIDFDGHILIIGNIKTRWVNLKSSNYPIQDGGGSLFVTGNIEADYFSNDFNKLVIINGSLIASKILNTEFEDSCLVINGNLKTEYYHGIDIEAEVNGNIEIDYGWGSCTNKDSKAILPKNDIDTSLNFLNVDKDCNSESINEIIKMRVANA